MSDSNIAHFVYDFHISQNNFPKTMDIVTHYLFFMRNPDPDRPKEITIKHNIDNTIHKLDIIWQGNYGQVNFNGKYLNMMRFGVLGYSIQDELSDNYRIFARGIFLSQNDMKNLKKLDLFININNEPTDITTIQEDYSNFNAVGFHYLKSFKLSMLGHTRLQMTKTALQAYKTFVNPHFFLLGNKPIRLNEIKHNIENHPDPQHPIHGLKDHFDEHGIEFESVQRF